MMELTDRPNSCPIAGEPEERQRDGNWRRDHNITVQDTDLPPNRLRESPKWSEILIRVVPCGMATGLDIGFSNASLKTLSLSFYTMVKSSVPFWVLVFALLFRVETPSMRLFGVMITISFGMTLMVSHVDVSAFDWTGFLFVMAASILSGLRIALIQVLLHGTALHLDHPLATNMFLAPAMFIGVFPSALLAEPVGKLASTPFFDTSGHAFHTIALILAGGTLAFTMVISEYTAIQKTSGLTISVAGIFKEVLTILLGVLWFEDVLTVMNVVGLIVCLSGIGFYQYYQYKKFISMQHQPLVTHLFEQDDPFAFETRDEHLESLFLGDNSDNEGIFDSESDVKSPNNASERKKSTSSNAREEVVAMDPTWTTARSRSKAPQKHLRQRSVSPEAIMPN
jgi:drug/metabolite transporter (DMT)-like permease